MIDSWNAAKLNERITQVEKKIQANDVIANPTGTATGELKKVTIDGTVYSILPVPEDPTELYFDGTDWIPKTLVWENEDDTTAQTGVSDVDVSDYTYLDLIVKINTAKPSSYEKLTIKVGDTSNNIISDFISLYGDDSSWTVDGFYRTYSISSGVLEISSCSRRIITSGTYSAGADNTYLVVSQIYGY